MNDVWNLDPIYRGFDDPAFGRDLEELKVAVSDFAKWTQNLASAEPLEALKAGIAQQEKLYTTGSKLVEYAMLRQSANTQDAEAGSRIGQIMSALSAAAAPQAAFRAWAKAAAYLPSNFAMVSAAHSMPSSSSRHFSR